MLTRELIAKIRKIEIYTSRLVNDRLAGQYHSVFKGRGMSFSEVRQYQHGDDVRLIDWNVTARTNEPYVKLFTEEREMTVMLLVDMSASGRFGSTRRKREIAAEVGAMLAFSAIKNNDRVGLIIFTDKVEYFVPAKKGKKHVLHIVSKILTYEPEARSTDLKEGLEFLGRVTTRKSVAFMISDFLAAGFQHALRVAHKRHDLVPVVISDPIEENLPKLGFVAFEDFETGELCEFDTSGPEARAYEKAVKRAREERETMFRKMKIDFVNVRTDKEYVRPLVQFFEARERRLRR
jgi:uncharacterized protein (DUF58 family)